MDARPEHYVNEERASVLLGLSTKQLHRLAEEAGIGRNIEEGGAAQRVFTYRELYRMCRLAAFACP
jgi:hypothetical protein